MKLVTTSLCVGFLATASHAVIVAVDEGRILSAPTGSLANAGWQYHGKIGAFTGIPIGPNHFIIAKHTGVGNVGAVLNYQSANYSVTSITDIAGTDLRICATSGTFTSYAPIWNPSIDGSEVGRPLFVAGRGIARGRAIYAPVGSADVVAPASTSSTMSVLPVDFGEQRQGPGPAVDPSYEFRGWEWGVNDTQQSWGTNVVEAVFNDQTFGQILGFDFDNDSSMTAYEAALAGGDSSGGVFVQNNAGVWKLAGVNFAVDGPFSRTPEGPYSFAALVDMGGYYIGSAADHVLVPDLAEAIPSWSYSTRVGGYRTQISNITGVSLLPEPGSLGLIGLSVIVLARRARSRLNRAPERA